ncbi:MAG TPA: ferredoxin--NADP reductase [Candidatus Limnocylindrales bacterium]|nr:ferredoxin--NADP reductase [Candidatus Limnocylindrales bacterium]
MTAPNEDLPVTDVATSERPIAAESAFYNARLTRREDLTPELAFFWVAFDGEPVAFEPGQYLTIGVESNGKLVQRPYSVASSPRQADEGYEYYVRIVEGGVFTPLLWRLPVGHAMHMKGPKGKFTLEPEDDRTHIFISSGTGIAPFISMMKTLLVDGAPRRAVVLHGVSYVSDLGYRELLEQWQASGEYPVTYVPTVSRPQAPENAGWSGRTGRVESIVPAVCDELGLTPANSIAYICGNPDMITAVDATLLERGFAPEQVKKELYWPKGKEPRGATASS